ncbi:hypothetical protein [Corynebacterium bovis]|uniref:hypothetical protein n=1 Tax=Corynebacterium bovis TaxID=36808 RepID=UPI003139E7BB
MSARRAVRRRGCGGPGGGVRGPAGRRWDAGEAGDGVVGAGEQVGEGVVERGEAGVDPGGGAGEAGGQRRGG